MQRIEYIHLNISKYISKCIHAQYSNNKQYFKQHRFLLLYIDDINIECDEMSKLAYLILGYSEYESKKIGKLCCSIWDFIKQQSHRKEVTSGFTFQKLVMFFLRAHTKNLSHKVPHTYTLSHNKCSFVSMLVVFCQE